MAFHCKILNKKYISTCSIICCQFPNWTAPREVGQIQLLCSGLPGLLLSSSKTIAEGASSRTGGRKIPWPVLREYHALCVLKNYCNNSREGSVGGLLQGKISDRTHHAFIFQWQSKFPTLHFSPPTFLTYLT